MKEVFMNKNRRLLQQCLIENMGLVIVLLALSILISILSLTVPWFMQYFTDTVVIGGAWENVRTVTGAFLVIILLRFAIDLMYERLMAYLIFQKITLSLRKRIEHILIYMKCRYLYKKKEEIAEKDIETILLGDVDAFKNVLSQTIKFFTEVLKLIVYLSVLLYYSLPVGLVVCARIPVYYIVSNLFDRPLSTRSEKNRAVQSKLIQKVKKIFQSLPAIKTLQMESRVEQDLDGQVTDYCRNQGKIAMLNAGYQELNTAINTVLNVLVLVLCGRAILLGSMTLGTMMLISNIQSRTTMPLFFFNNYYLQYKSSFPGISRLVRFLETETENTAPCPDKPHFETLALRNVSYSYVEGQCALKDFSLEIRSGDKLILTGDNMTGKSTLLKLLAGLLTADRGQILVDGKESADHELRDLATLFLQNQDSYCYFDQEGSGGEVQLMNLSIMRDVSSPLILLDEADASINRSRLDEVYQFLDSDATVILVTHRNTAHILQHYPEARVIHMEA